MHDASQSNALRSEQREVTLLFADLRGSTELIASLQTDPLACELLTHVMECISDAVAAHDGFIVDYFGDGLMAMWNAPSDQPDHADSACHAALLMLAALPTVTDEWMNVTHAELRVGIGVHTGPVQVGNAGSARKVKYGPRGPNVNLASRVEAATKELHVPCLATQTTINQLSKRLATNRVCRAQMPGLQQPIDLYAVTQLSMEETVKRAWQSYDEAIRHFEHGELDAAADKLASIDESLAMVPVRFLRDRVQNERGRSLRRRNSDKPIALPEGVIPLAAK